MGGILLKSILLLWLGMSATFAHAIPVGFNQSWFHNDYAVQYLDGIYDRQEVDRIFDLTSLAGSKTIRLWFFESSDFPMIEWKNGQIVSLRQDYIRNVLETLRLARSKGIRVYMTLLDGQSYRPDVLSSNSLNRLKSIYQQKGGAVFLSKVLGPLLEAIQDAGLGDVIGRIDLSNEMDAVIKRFGFQGNWKGASRMLCQWREFIHGYHAFATTPVTFSVRLHPLVSLPDDVISDHGPMACADHLDFHSYDDQGVIMRCGELREYSKKGKKDLILGEFGQSYFNSNYDDELQKRLTDNYIKNAPTCGFKEALTWRLSDVRPGYNKEARYSFESYGKMRPAFWLIQQHNLK
jgi:hypothetical protein